MTPIFAPAPHRSVPDTTAALQQLEQLVVEAGELRARIAFACTGTAAGATHWPGRRRMAVPNGHLAHVRTRNGS